MSLIVSAYKKIQKCKKLYLLLSGLICLTTCAVYFSTSAGEDEPAPKPTNQTSAQPSHVLCLMIPYRERFEELLEFVPHMSKHLNRQSLKYHIVVVNHMPDGHRFNKGSTLNAGFIITRRKFPECDYIGIQDVDTLPLSDEVLYGYPGDVVYHGIPLGYHPIRVYYDPTYIGGILLMSNEIYMRMNGFGNNFWGWGFEDIDFWRRMVKHDVSVTRPEKLSSGPENSFKHSHRTDKPRDTFWCLNQAAASATRDRTDHTGISDVNFTIASEYNLAVEGFSAYVFNINIQCVFKITPWCKPFCIENITMPKSVWEMDAEFSPFRTFGMEDAPKNRKPADLGLTADSPMWNRIIGYTSHSKRGK